MFCQHIFTVFLLHISFFRSFNKARAMFDASLQPERDHYNKAPRTTVVFETLFLLFFNTVVANRDQFQNLRTQFLTQQSLLTEVNNQLLSLKKDIKCSRESQLDNLSQISQDSQNTQTGVGGNSNNNNSKVLIKRAKELIMQKKFLLQLLNAQKELKLKITSLRYKNICFLFCQLTN